VAKVRRGTAVITPWSGAKTALRDMGTWILAVIVGVAGIIATVIGRLGFVKEHDLRRKQDRDQLV
jgi:hypothetical protein